jgi:hypothetical protein
MIKCYHKKITGLYILIAILSCFNQAWAEIFPCEPKISIHNPIQTHTNVYEVDLAQPYYMHLSGTWFKIPFGYSQDVKPWDYHYKEKPKGTNFVKTEGVFLRFWMPSLRWYEAGEDSNPFNPRPCENGRPQPTLNEYLVNIDLKWSWKPGYKASGNIGVSKDIETAVRGTNFSMEKAPREFSLIKHGTYFMSEGKKIIYSYYFSEPNFDPQIFLSCDSADDPPDGSSFDLCKGTIFYKKESLEFDISFPSDKISEWKTILATSKTMLEQWREAAQ